MIKTKNLIFIIASVFALVFLMSAVSAATLAEWNLTVDGSAINVDDNVNAGIFVSQGVEDFDFHIDNGAYAENWPTEDSVDDSKYFQVTISPKTDYVLTISDIDFDYSASISTGSPSFELKYSKQSGFSEPTTLTTETDVAGISPKHSSNSGSIQVSSGETLTLRWYGYNFNADTNEFRIKDLVIKGTAEPETLDFCEFADNGNLKLSIEDIQVIDKNGEPSFGDDEEWFPLDKVEIEIEVENDGDEKIKNIVVEWGLYNLDKKDWVIDDEESDFNLKDGDKETITLTFELDDVDEFEDDDTYAFYVWATGEDEEFDGEETCVSASEDIEIIIESDFVILDDIEVPELAQCDGEVILSADVWNIGDDDQEEVKVVIYNKDLGLNEVIEIGDIDAFDSEPLDFTFQIPESVEEKMYYLSLKVYDEDNDIYENDFDDEQSAFSIPLKVEGNCAVASASVSAVLEEGGKPGKPLVVRATIVNTGDKTTTYLLNAAGYAEWASTGTLDQNTVTLNAAQSQDILLTFEVKKDVSGDKLFQLEVLSENELILSQPISVTISKKGGITGAVISGDNWYLWGIGALNVILVILIIVIAVRIARR